MSAVPKQKMTVDDFLTWADTQPGRWELYDGVPVEMSSERVIHGRVKYLAARAFDRAIEAAGVPCQFLLDSVLVRIDKHRGYQPDLLVYCGPALPGDAIEAPNPVVVLEILSPGNAMKDLRDKLLGYFEVPGISHCLIVDPDNRLVIHHARGEGDSFATRIVSDRPLKLEPPGIEIAVADQFPPA